MQKYLLWSLLHTLVVGLLFRQGSLLCHREFSFVFIFLLRLINSPQQEYVNKTNGKSNGLEIYKENSQRNTGSLTHV